MNKYKKIIVALSLLCIVLAAVEINLLKVLYKEKSLPEAGVIPNGETAVKYAEAIWLPIYGDKIYNGLPFRINLQENHRWYVRGRRTEDDSGGVPELKFNGTDGSIFYIIFY